MSGRSAVSDRPGLFSLGVTTLSGQRIRFIEKTTRLHIRQIQGG